MISLSVSVPFISRRRLPNKLVSVNTDSWLCSYLHQREYYAVLEGERSKSLLSQAGAPQGAVLSSLTLITYIFTFI